MMFFLIEWNLCSLLLVVKQEDAGAGKKREMA
jgi:hypothetical protein